MNIFMDSLFPSKNDFDRNHFENLVVVPYLEDIIMNALESAISKIQEYESSTTVSGSLFSHMMHERIFNEIQNAINLCEFSKDFTFEKNVRGNERLYFIYGQYIFILKNMDASTNQTKQSDCIKEQEADKHIITIGYRLDEYHTSLKSASFLYIKGKETLYQRDITSTGMFEMQNSITEQPIKRAKPKLKSGAKKEVI